MRILILLAALVVMGGCAVSPKIDIGVLDDRVGSLAGTSQKGFVDVRLLTCDDLWVFSCDFGYFHLSGLFTGPPVNNGDEGAIEGPYFRVTVLEL